MIKRVVDISSPAKLSLKNRQLVVDLNQSDPVTIPLEDLGVLVLGNPAICYTQALLAECWKENIAVVLCDDRYMPGAMIIPFEGHSLHSKLLRDQFRISQPTCKRLWQSIIRAKILAQGQLLSSLNIESYPITIFAQKVQSGDPSNVEAQAARAYWCRLFGKQFRRDFELFGINSLLNYGYAVLRSAVARAVVGSGLHPALGIHHSNQYNNFALADDLMEPLRPLVDGKVYQLQQEFDELVLSKTIKQELIKILGTDCIIKKEKFPLITVLQHYTASLRDIVSGEHKDFVIPELIL